MLPHFPVPCGHNSEPSESLSMNLPWLPLQDWVRRETSTERSLLDHSLPCPTEPFPTMSLLWGHSGSCGCWGTGGHKPGKSCCFTSSSSSGLAAPVPVTGPWWTFTEHRAGIPRAGLSPAFHRQQQNKAQNEPPPLGYSLMSLMKKLEVQFSYSTSSMTSRNMAMGWCSSAKGQKFSLWHWAV